MESELERLQAERDIKVARARLERYEREIGPDKNSQSLQQLDQAKSSRSFHAAPKPFCCPTRSLY